MNRLEKRLRAALAAAGPMPLDRFMATALTDAEDGYYTKGEGIGGVGDFITAPEISQMFGELIGLWMVDSWRRLGAPATAAIVEQGPGRGVLMDDALRVAARAAPDFLHAARLSLLEASPALRAVQAARLSAYEPRFIDDLAQAPDGPLLLVANEFFDALPVRQLVRRGQGWRERAVGLQDGTLALVECDAAAPPPPDLPPGLPPGLPPDLPPLAEGEIIEISPQRQAVAAAIGAHIADKGGAALVIDYGHAASAPGDTLQAVRAHKPHPPLRDPGEADLTAHVDFAAIASAACGAGAAVYGPIGQRQFLLRLGIEARLAQLLRGAAPETANRLTDGFRRLTDPARMGHLFKVLCITRPDFGVPTGYVAREAFRTPA